MTTQSLIVVVGLVLLALLPKTVIPAADHHVVQLVETPYPAPRVPQPEHKIQPVPQVEAKIFTPDPIKVPVVRKPQNRVEPAPTAPEIKIAQQAVALPQAAPVIPKPAVRTNVFSTGSSKPVTTSQPPTRVQTGGFGDPNGVPASNHDNNKPVTIAQQGAFDLPGGGGHGNGTAGTQGTKGVVASAGFGSGTAVGSGSEQRNTLTVREGGFGGAEPAANKSAVQHRESAPDKVVPAEVLSKPTPEYTDEARRLHIEGEVLVEVIFEASGAIRVVRVIRGLGHGLDDRAVLAAQQIHFKPALRDGKPADSRGILHILFQLA
jgi:TonB family protein